MLLREHQKLQHESHEAATSLEALAISRLKKMSFWVTVKWVSTTQLDDLSKCLGIKMKASRANMKEKQVMLKKNFEES
ncbi:unnamed protein product [Camellia sinensis]